MQVEALVDFFAEINREVTNRWNLSAPGGVFGRSGTRSSFDLLLDHRKDDKILWKNDQYRFVANYQVNLQTTDTFDQETRSITEIAQKFAQSLVANLLEGF